MGWGHVGMSMSVEMERGRMAQERWEQEGRSELSVSASCPLGGMIDSIITTQSNHTLRMFSVLA